MSDNPITKKITRHVHGYWRGWPGLNSAHSPSWTVGLLQRIVDDCRAAGYDDNTELKPEIERDPSGLSAFRLTVTEPVAADEHAEPLLCSSIAPRLVRSQPIYQCALVADHLGPHCEDAIPTPTSMRWTS